MTNTENMHRENNAVPVSDWLARLDYPEHLDSFHAAYGTKIGLIQERAALVRRTLTAFHQRFGDLPVRIFRAPGRINLRGMHVDTHGGYLNLMTHQREIILVAAKSPNGPSILTNAHPAHADTEFVLDAENGNAATGHPWFEFISHSDIRNRVGARRASLTQTWANYCIGAALRTQHAFPDCSMPALKVMVDGDLPGGAALSSSAALSIASLLAWVGYAGRQWNPEQLIQAEQDVEWYAGARVGLSDQAAIIMGRSGCLLHITLFGDDFTLDNARYYSFPDDLALLVVNSYTSRNLSGAQRVQYSLNRFAYSMALNVLRTELLRAGWDADLVCSLDRLSRLTAETLGGPARVYELLMGMPETIDLDTLRKRYAPPNLDETYARYFDGLPPEEQPRRIPLRGPLLFGIAESERACRFPDLLERGDYVEAGTLMSIGHDGDRVRSRDGGPFRAAVDDAALAALARKGVSLSLCPGNYGAGSAALDMLVDAALDGGALGASLTGAGIAGAVLALCHIDDAGKVSDAVRRCLRSPSYAWAANRTTSLSETKVMKAITVNHAVAGAGELILP